MIKYQIMTKISMILEEGVHGAVFGPRLLISHTAFLYSLKGLSGFVWNIGKYEPL